MATLNDISTLDLLCISTNSVGYTHYSTVITYYDLSDLCLYLVDYYQGDESALDLVHILYEQSLSAECDDD